MRFALVEFLLFITLAAVSCRSIAASPVENQLTLGQAIYEKGCATEVCHGVNGEGIRSGNEFRDWPLVGEEFQHRNPTSQVIFDVVRSGGESDLRALTDQQVYDAIAYELSLNGVELSAPLNEQNAPVIYSGAAAEPQVPGSLFPPTGNARLMTSWSPPGLPISTENDDLRVRLTQIALASSIGETVQPGGERYLLVVFNLYVLANRSFEVGPQQLSLVTQDDKVLEPLEVGLDYPVARFLSPDDPA